MPKKFRKVKKVRRKGTPVQKKGSERLGNDPFTDDQNFTSATPKREDNSAAKFADLARSDVEEEKIPKKDRGAARRANKIGRQAVRQQKRELKDLQNSREDEKKDEQNIRSQAPVDGTNAGRFLSAIGGGVAKGFQALKDATSRLDFDKAAFSNALAKPPRDLSKDDIFPSLGESIAVGQFSGDRIGSGTIYEPQSNIFPIEIVNARAQAMLTKTKKDTTKMLAAQKEVYGTTRRETAAQYQQGYDSYMLNEVTQGLKDFGGDAVAYQASERFQRLSSAAAQLDIEFETLANARNDIQKQIADGKEIFVTPQLQKYMDEVGKGAESIQAFIDDPTLFNKMNNEFVAHQGINTMINHYTDPVQESVDVFINGGVPAGASEDFKNSFIRAKATGDLDVIYNLYRTGVGQELIDGIKNEIGTSVTGQHYDDATLELFIESRFKNSINIKEVATESKIRNFNLAATANIKKETLKEKVQDDTPIVSSDAGAIYTVNNTDTPNWFQAISNKITGAEGETEFSFNSASTTPYTASGVDISFDSHFSLSQGVEVNQPNKGGRYNINRVDKLHTFVNEAGDRQILISNSFDKDGNRLKQPTQEEINAVSTKGYQLKQYANVTEASSNKGLNKRIDNILVPVESIIPHLNKVRPNVSGIEGYDSQRGFAGGQNTQNIDSTKTQNVTTSDPNKSRGKDFENKLQVFMKTNNFTRAEAIKKLKDGGFIK